MRWILVAPLLLTACGDFAPWEGLWDLYNADVTQDTCGILDESETDSSASVLELTDNGDGTLSVVMDDELTWTCTLTDMDFDCGDVIIEERDFTEDPGLDAVLTSTGTVTGAFTDEQAMAGQTHVEIACEGTECSTVAENSGWDLPCAMTQEWTALALTE